MSSESYENNSTNKDKVRTLRTSQSAATLPKNRSVSAGIVRSLSTQALHGRPQTAVTTGGRLTSTNKQVTLLYPNFDIRKKQSTRAVFGKFSRFPSAAADDNIPGPDQYSTERMKIKKIPLGKIGTQSRFQTDHEDSATGSNYNPPSFSWRGNGRTEHGTGGSSFGKHARFFNDSEVVPGPEYAVHKQPRVRSGKLGKAKRFASKGDKHDQGFTYAPPTFSARHNGKMDPNSGGVSFTKTNRFSIARPDTPGPNAYVPDPKFKQQIVKFNKAKRFQDNTGNDVGFCLTLETFRSPSSRQKNANNSAKFGSSHRFMRDPEGETPSVHNYTLNTSTMRSGIKVCKAARFGSDDATEPGPGDYSKLPAKKIGGGAMNKHPRFAAESDSQETPGPKYDTRHAKSKKPSAGKFNKQKRFVKSAAPSVGPSAYSPKVETCADARVRGVVAWGLPKKEPDGDGVPGPNYAPAPAKIPGGAIGKTKRWKEQEMRPY